jgi:hypothetical protein
MNFLLKSSNFFLIMALVGLVSHTLLYVKCADAQGDKQPTAEDGAAEKRAYGNADEAAVAAAALKTNEYLEQIQQRLPFKLAITPRLFNLIMREQLRESIGSEDLEDDDDDYSASSELSDDNEASPAKRALSKKESPIEQRNREMRRQHTARWDIGFGKRAVKSNAFMNAMYGKRSGLGSKNAGAAKALYGRKQQWDIQYGRR